jgi:predicted dehydrogenase
MSPRRGAAESHWTPYRRTPALRLSATRTNFPKEKIMRKPLHVGVIGLGMGRYHLERYQNVRQAKVEAICDSNVDLAHRTAKEFSVPQVFTSFDEFLANADIDAVSIVVPNFLHKEMTLACLEKGWHILCEKPMAMNTAEALEMQAKVQESGRKFMIHFNQRFRPEHQYFKKVVASGELGPVYYATAGWRRMRYIPGLGGWFTQKKFSGGGPLIDLGVHMLDLTRWIIGRPKVTTVSGSTFGEIGARIARAEGKAFDVEDLASALIRFDNGTTLHLEVSWALNFERREKIFLELSGPAGGLSSISYAGKEKEISIFREQDGVLTQTEPISYPTTFASAQQHFIDCILNDTEPDANAEDGVEIMRILDAIYQSAHEHREVTVR